MRITGLRIRINHKALQDSVLNLTDILKFAQSYFVIIAETSLAFVCNYLITKKLEMIIKVYHISINSFW